MIFLQRTFTSLVHAHAGRTQIAARGLDTVVAVFAKRKSSKNSANLLAGEQGVSCQALSDSILIFISNKRVNMLYRFFSDNQNSLSSLANNFLWFSDLKDFNDPFETQINNTLKYENLEEVEDFVFINELKAQKHPQLDNIQKNDYLLELAITNQKRYQALKKEVLEVTKQKHVEVYSKYANLKWCCFSESDRKFGSPIQRKLMWGHYSNGLRGFLIEFNKNDLINSLDESVKIACSDQFIVNAPINYVDLAPIPFYSEFISKIKHSPDLANFLTQKPREWRYETENRLGTQEQKVSYAVNAVKKIIVGQKMAKEYREMLLIIINSKFPNVEVLEAYIDREDFNIKTRKL